MIQPSVAHERAAALAALHLPADDPWRHNAIVLRAVFFALTCAGVAAFNELCRIVLLDWPHHLIAAAASALLAEWLIRRRRFFGTGVEEALWLCATLNVVFALPSSNKPEAVLVMGLAIAIAAARMREPLFGAAAVCTVIIYAKEKMHGDTAPLTVGIVLTVLAALALQREWQRRSAERFFQASVLLFPLVAYIACSETAKLYVWPAFALLAVALFALALRSRDRVILIAASIATLIAAIEFARHYVHIRYEYKLIDGGVIALASAIALSRVLRTRNRGFIASPEAAKDYEQALQLLGIVHVTPAAPREAPGDGFQSGGGDFGGAGSSGSY